VSDRMTPREASQIIGYGPTCLLRRFVRKGLLPYPDDKLTWSRNDVMKLKAWMDCRRETGESCEATRPQHVTH